MSRHHLGAGLVLPPAMPAILLVTVIVVAVLVSGAMIAVVPPLALVLLLLLPSLLLAGVLYPEFSVAILLLIAAGFLPQSVLPGIGFAGGAVRIEDMLLANLVVTLFVRVLSGRRGALGCGAKVLWPLAALFVLMALQSCRAVLLLDINAKSALAELRTYLYLLPLALIPLMLNTEVAVRRLWRLIVWSMFILAIGQIIQGALSIPVLHGGRLEATVTLDVAYTDTTRSTVPGVFLLIFGLLYSVSVFLTGGRWRLLWLAGAMLFAASLLFTYGRALWLSTALGVLLLGMQFGLTRLVRAALVGVGVLVLLIGTIAFFKPTMLEAAIDRLMSIGTEVSSGSSINWRRIENDYAWAKIQDAPILGIGLGASYKPISGGLDAWVEQTRFIHNGYLFLLMKTGIVGLGVFIFFWLQLLRLAWLQRSSESDQQRVLARTLFVLALLPAVTALVRPEWADQGTLLVFSMLGGVLVARMRTAAVDNAPETTPAPQRGLTITRAS